MSLDRTNEPQFHDEHPQRVEENSFFEVSQTIDPETPHNQKKIDEVAQALDELQKRATQFAKEALVYKTKIESKQQEFDTAWDGLQIECKDLTIDQIELIKNEFFKGVNQAQEKVIENDKQQTADQKEILKLQKQYEQLTSGAKEITVVNAPSIEQKELSNQSMVNIICEQFLDKTLGEVIQEIPNVFKNPLPREVDVEKNKVAQMIVGTPLRVFYGIYADDVLNKNENLVPVESWDEIARNILFLIHEPQPILTKALGLLCGFQILNGLLPSRTNGELWTITGLVANEIKRAIEEDHFDSREDLEEAYVLQKRHTFECVEEIIEFFKDPQYQNWHSFMDKQLDILEIIQAIDDGYREKLKEYESRTENKV